MNVMKNIVLLLFVLTIARSAVGHNDVVPEHGEKTLFWEPTNAGPVKCDATHECPPDNTCCKLASGQWGCCPLPKAVCCSDHLHCCPHGTTCDVSAGKCNKGVNTFPWFEKQPAVFRPLPQEPTNAGPVKCDATHECPPDNTCCKLASGQWGCCPLPKAVCCSDHLHCCPHGTTCDVSAGKCNRGVNTFPWFEKQPAVVRPLPQEPTNAGPVKCDATHECPPDNTCCKLASGQWGCCPLPKAVCCSDHLHCCPHGTTCDVSAGKCNRGVNTFPWFEKQPAVVRPLPQEPTNVGPVKCDATHECPPDNTCCKLASGQWGCCPLPKAVCCSDHLHCCPHGTTCDVSAGKCNRGVNTFPWFEKQPAVVRPLPQEPTNAGPVKCDATHECPPDNTCCKLASGQWGCCPLPKAVCCSDHLHCCPHGTTCDVSAGKCNRGVNTFPWFEKQPAVVRPLPQEPTNAGPVKCDATHECPPDNTCCKLASGQWGCCPLPKAVCCSDHLHCCPHGTTCDVSAGKCNRGVNTFPWFERQPAVVRPLPQEPTNAGPVKCDATHECPPDNTCCKLASGQWGCCPLPKAVCCSDHLHCCPHGTTCDVSAGKCNRGVNTFPWFEKQPAVVRPLPQEPTNAGPVKCDATHECPPDNTCCKLASGQWGCCPLPKAVCCSDHLHCCPHGTTCDVSAGKCNRGVNTFPWFEKQPAVVRPLPQEPTNVGAVKCDATHECPPDNTCCKLASGQWGCCPMPKAVCCSDHLHCCPHGTTCDVSAGTCNQGVITLPWFEKQPAVVRPRPQP